MCRRCNVATQISVAAAAAATINSIIINNIAPRCIQSHILETLVGEKTGQTATVGANTNALYTGDNVSFLKRKIWIDDVQLPAYLFKRKISLLCRIVCVVMCAAVQHSPPVTDFIQKNRKTHRNHVCLCFCLFFYSILLRRQDVDLFFNSVCFERGGK